MDERDRQRLRSLARTVTRLAFGEQSIDRKCFDAHLAAMWVEECDSTRSRLERVADRWWATVVAAASSEAAGSVPATAFLRAVDECIGGPLSVPPSDAAAATPPNGQTGLQG